MTAPSGLVRGAVVAALVVGLSIPLHLPGSDCGFMFALAALTARVHAAIEKLSGWLTT